MIEHIKWAYGLAPVPHWMRYDRAEQVFVRIIVYWFSATALYLAGMAFIGWHG